MSLENKIISKEIQQYLYDNGKTLATAESCTGGRIAEAIIAVPGASNYFKGGIICYTNEIKEKLLHVSHETLEAKTAVSEEVAIQMVQGACEALNVDYAIAATGIAGPGGGTPEIPVGTIWLAYGGGNDALVGVSGIHPDENTGDFNAACCEGSYHFSVTFHDHFLIIRQLSAQPAKCFGSGAGIVGIYILMPAKG